jgi:uncharacterized protein
MLAQAEPNEADNGPRSAGVTHRLCAATRRVRPVDELVRFVAAPDGALIPDLKRRLPGRGVWVGAERTAVADAVRRNAFQRSLRADVAVPRDLPEIVDGLMEHAVLAALAIARKAGQAVTGFTKVETAARQGMVAALMHAAEAQPDGVRKIAEALRQGGGNPAGIPRLFVFTSAQLDLAFGRPNVVHAALLAGRASETFLARWRTLERYRADDPGDRDDGLAQPNQKASRLGSE